MRNVALATALAAGLIGPEGAPAQSMITVAPSQSAPEPAERPVTFSAGQVQSGSRAYDRHCVMCHGKNLDDGEFGGPPLVGLRFEEMFGGLPVSALYAYIEAAMPPDRPGRISARERTDIVAFILSRNGYPLGTALPTSLEAMDFLMVEK